jgi:recombination protein RecA
MGRAAAGEPGNEPSSVPDIGAGIGIGAAENAPAWDPACLAGRLVEVTSGRAFPSPVRPAGEAVPAPWGPAPSSSPSARDAGSAVLSVAASLVAKAQHLGEPAAWINARPSSFYPPDLDAGGIDLGALVVVRVADASSAARAADKLLRSGAFGLVVLDVGARATVPAPLLGRLLALARKHRATVLFLTEKAGEAASLAPIVSLRVVASRRRVAPARFACSVEAVKDKCRAPGWKVEESFGAPPGLR